MRTEAEFDYYLKKILDAVNIVANLQSCPNVEINGALQTASKNQTGGTGYPDIIAVVNNFVLVMENKSDRAKLCLREGQNISMTVDATKNYAVNGAVFYARKIIDGTSYKKVFAFGNVGDRKHHILKPVFISEDTVKELPEVETFKNFTAENINAYYNRMVCGIEPPEEIELRKIINRAATLHEYLRNYGQLGETEKPLVVSAILLALDEGLDCSTLNHDEIINDGTKIFEYLERKLKRAKVSPEVKREQVLDQFRLIKNRPLLNNLNENLDKTPLRFFAEYIQNNIYDAVINNSAEDYLGRFYGEFISYSGGDGQSLGVVLTPRHITELFCDLVNLQVDDVVFDPCCGTGSFLISAMHRMLADAKTDSQRTHIKQKQIHGIEIRDDMFSIATTNMILRGDGQSNLICGNFFDKVTSELQLLGDGVTVGFMNPPYSQAKVKETSHLSELRFILHLLNSITRDGRAAVIVPVSAMIGKTKDDKFIKSQILKNHTLEGVISLNKNTFYSIGTVPCIAVFTTGRPHPNDKLVKFINFEDDGFIVKKHIGLVESERAKDRKQFLLSCWRGEISDCPSKFMVQTTITDADEWLHSFYYYNDELPSDADFTNTVADYLTFEFNMIVHGRGYLFNSKKNFQPFEEIPTLNNKSWKEFFITDIAEIVSGHDINTSEQINGNIPYISSSSTNNGIYNFIENENDTLESHCISVNRTGSVGYAFAHPYSALYSNNCRKLRPKINNKFVLLFIATQITAQREKYNYGYIMGSGRLQRQKILLPIDDKGEPDWAFMESYIRGIEEQLNELYLDYLEVPRAVDIEPLENKSWREFLITDIADIVSGCDIYEDERIAGNIPYIGASANNNGICHFVGNKNETLESNCISVNRNGSVGYAFFHPYAALYSNDCRKIRPKVQNKFSSIFTKTVENRYLYVEKTLKI